MITNELYWCYDLAILVHSLWHYQVDVDGDEKVQLSPCAQIEDLKAYLLLYFMT